MLQLADIKHVHVELTTKCNARCPMCMRNYRGGEFNSGYPLTELSLDQFRCIFPESFLSSLMAPLPAVGDFQPRWFGKSGMTFNGNLGDFCAARDGLDIVRYLTDHAVPVYVNTNGSLRTKSWWRQLGELGITVGFALDGLADTHHLYRQDTDWHTIIANATEFIAAGGRAVWRFVPFDHNQHQMQACQELSQQLGFAEFENIYDGRDKTPVYTRDGRFSHHIGKLLPTESETPPSWHDSVQNHITWYDKNTVKLINDTEQLDLRCKHIIDREIYLAADGTVYPCCFLGFYPKSMHHPGNRELRDLVTDNNALEVGLEKAISWFYQVERSWNQPSIAQGRTYQCVSTCNRAKAN